MSVSQLKNMRYWNLHSTLSTPQLLAGTLIIAIFSFGDRILRSQLLQFCKNKKPTPNSTFTLLLCKMVFSLAKSERKYTNVIREMFRRIRKHKNPYSHHKRTKKIERTNERMRKKQASDLNIDRRTSCYTFSFSLFLILLFATAAAAVCEFLLDFFSLFQKRDAVRE